MGIDTSISGTGSNTPEALLRDLGHHKATGVLEINHRRGEVSHVWLRDGQMYSLNVPGYRPALGIRLLSGGILSPEQLSSAVTEQRTRFAGHRIGEVLVHLGYVTGDVIDSFVVEQVHDQLADLLDLPVTDSTFHAGRRIRQDTITARPVDTLLAIAKERRHRWAAVLTDVGGSEVVPKLGPQGRGTAETPLGPHDWALLCRVDGRRDLTELARVCGFTIFETAQVVSDLSRAGLLVLPEVALEEEDDAPLAAVLPLRPLGAPTPVREAWAFEDGGVGEPEAWLDEPVRQAQLRSTTEAVPEVLPPEVVEVATAVVAAEAAREAYVQEATVELSGEDREPLDEDAPQPPKPTDEGQPTGESEVEDTEPGLTTEPDPEVEPEPEPEPEPKPVLELEPEPEPDPELNFAAEPEPPTESALVTQDRDDPVFELQPQPEQSSEPNQAPIPEPESDPSLVLQHWLEPAPEPTITDWLDLHPEAEPTHEAPDLAESEMLEFASQMAAELHPEPQAQPESEPEEHAPSGQAAAAQDATEWANSTSAMLAELSMFLSDEPAAEPEPETPEPPPVPPVENPEANAAELGADQEADGETSGIESDADTGSYMRELSGLTDAQPKAGPAVTRRVVPLTEPKKKRRIWGR